MAPFECGVVVPVRDEGSVLDGTVPALLAARGRMAARIVWVCNGCTDDSAERIRRHAGPGAEIVVRDVPGKTGALQAGDDALGTLFPRLYLDADARLRPGDLPRLMAPLISGATEMTGARYAFDDAAATPISAAMARCWLSLPHARDGCFVGAIGLSRSGRARWDAWPDLLGDDVFAASMIPAERRTIVRDAVVTTLPPPSFAGWIAMRRRWLRGERQLRRLGIAVPGADGQRAALLRRMVEPGDMAGAWAFVAARLIAAATAGGGETAWLPARRRGAPAASAGRRAPDRGEGQPMAERE